MIGTFHTHTTYCDGSSTPGEMVQAAIAKGLPAIGFSGHGCTPFDLRYCMQDTDSYIREIRALQEACKDTIQIYLGIEEDAFAPADRSRFEYIIGSSHYLQAKEQFLPIDSSPEHFQKCLEAFQNDPLALARAYYSSFCAYIKRRKPDIIGHFDLITKYEEVGASVLLSDPRYHALAEKYIASVADLGCLFEYNTGAVAKGYRTVGYPDERLLHVLKKHGSKVILSADSHHTDTLDFGFAEATAYLRDIGFRQLYTMHNGEFVKYDI